MERLSMESQPQNPEFRIISEIFHPCIQFDVHLYKGPRTVLMNVFA